MLVSEIITAAFREGNLLEKGATPTTDESAEALPIYNNFLASLFGFELGEALTDWPVPQPQRTAPVPANYPHAPLNKDLTTGVYTVPPSNVRLLVKNTSALTVYLQNNPNDGARVGYADLGHTATFTVDGNGRLIESGASVAITAETPPTVNTGREWFYRADLANWILLKSAYLTTDDSPLPDQFDDLLITGLSLRLSSRFGNEPRAMTIATFDRLLSKLKARYRQITPAAGISDDVPNSEQSYDPGDIFWE